ncbi:MAG: exodeoxyribonuclease VII large subunit [Planctomycetota bacterium]
MSGTVELAPDGAHLLIRFPYREDLVAEVKSVPGRRWDPKQKTWRVPSAQVENVYAIFARHLFEFAPEVSGLLAGTLGAPARPADGDAPATAGPRRQLQLVEGDADGDAESATPAASLTISALNQQVRDGLRQQWSQRVWITGEVVDYDKQQDRQHKFFTLVEKAEGEARPRARVEAALFEQTCGRLFARIAELAPEFALRDGIEIRAAVRIDLYVPSGRFQVIVEDLDPAFTLGKLALTREQILAELRDRGLADRNRALPLPIPPLRIGVLASPDSDGWNDFLRHLQEAPVGFDVTLVPVRVQGTELRPSMLAGLRWFAAHADEFDVVCVLRGGGSRTDLAWFDDLEVAVAVAQLPIKVLVGIGHQRDQSVLDVIAHSEKTPTAVAEHLVDQVETARRAVAQHAVRLQRAAGRRLQAAHTALASAAGGLRQAVAARMAHERLRLVTAARDLGRGAARRCGDARRDLTHLARELAGTAVRRCTTAQRDLLLAQARVRQGAALRIERATARLDQLAARHRLLDPRAVLRRGFAIVRAEDGAVLPSAARIRPQQLLQVQLRDGTVRTRAESIEETP